MDKTKRIKRLTKLRELRELIKNELGVRLDCYSLAGNGFATKNKGCEGAFDLIERLSTMECAKAIELLGDHYHSHETVRYSLDEELFTRFLVKDLG